MIGKLSHGKITQYVVRKGMICPYCELSDLTASGIQMDGFNVFEEVSCVSCGKSWTDIYKLYDLVEE